MRAAVSIWADVSGVQGGQDFSVGDGALPAISLGNSYSECALPQARRYQCRCTISRSGFGKPRRSSGQTLGGILQTVPQVPFGIVAREAFPPDDIRRPRRWQIEP